MKTYEKPKVKVIPLKVEERLMACLKTTEGGTCKGVKENKIS